MSEHPPVDQEEPADVEVRLARVLELHSKGLTQIEIAGQLGLQQSTVSKDLKKIRSRMAKEMEAMVSDQVWEFARHLSGTDAAIKKMWEIADDKETPPKSRIEALAYIMEFYESRRLHAALGSRYMEAGMREKSDEMYGR